MLNYVVLFHILVLSAHSFSSGPVLSEINF